MSTKLTLELFKANYTQPLNRDSKNGQPFVKLPISNYQELGCMQENLLAVMEFILLEMGENSRTKAINYAYPLLSVVEVLQALNTTELFEGLDRLMLE